MAMPRDGAISRDTLRSHALQQRGEASLFRRLMKKLLQGLLLMLLMLVVFAGTVVAAVYLLGG